MKISINTPIARIEAHLPEDAVKDLLRIAISYATTGTDAACQAADDAQVLELAPRVIIHPAGPKPQAGPAEPGYKGFLYVKCEACGTVKGFCVKTPITEHRCSCGHSTALQDLKPLYVSCKCGDSFKYHTNITDRVFSMDCIKCGSPVDVELHEKKGVYETMKEEG